MKELKLCENCRWFVPYRPITGESGMCKSPNNPTKIRLTDGKPEVIEKNAVNQRDFNRFEAFILKRCGRRARWFEPK